jgi:hypothetical protein
MEEHTSKGQGGKRSLLRLPQNVAEGESAASLLSGDGETSGTGLDAQAEPGRSFENWPQFVGCVIQANKHYKFKIRTVWHPDPVHELIHTDQNNIAVEKGAVKAQLNTAQFVDL